MSTNCEESDVEFLHLNDTWKFYFHDPDNHDWDHSSYALIAEITTANEFNGIHKELGSDLQSGMFFLMRKNVFPSWDDPSNLNGGCMCLKIPKPQVELFWRELCANLLGDTLLKTSYNGSNTCINGVSVSPKNFFCIVKLWFSNNEVQDAKHLNMQNFGGATLYKANNQESSRVVKLHGS